VRSLRQLLSNIRSRPKAHLAAVLVAVSNHFSVVALAAAPAVLSMPALQPAQSTCGPDSSCDVPVAADQNPNLSLPIGMSQCHDSGPAAACGSTADAQASAPGTASTPPGTNPCVPVAGKVFPTNLAACTDVTTGPSDDPVSPSGSVDAPGVKVPDELTLTSSSDAFHAGQAATITATANLSVTTGDRSIEIFDLTSGNLIGGCGQGSQCIVAYTAGSGVHELAAFVTTPTPTVPDDPSALASNHLRIGWLSSGIAASQAVVSPGQAVTITATSTLDVLQSGRWLEIYDVSAGTRVTYCSRGTRCTTTMKMTGGGTHKLVGYVTGTPEAVSTPIYVTWLGVSLSATSIGPSTSGTVWLKATSNADLTNTPWVMGVYDQQGHLVEHTCKTGTTCQVSAWTDGTSKPVYTAYIGALPDARPGIIEGIARRVGAPPALSLVDIQAKSGPVEPAHLLWGVDSCKALIGDPTGDLFWAVSRKLGTPDFWGRYLTDTVCPAISAREIAIAADYHMGILPIYNDYNCSDVSYYATGNGYAVAAVAAAQRLGIPAGRAIAIDIEPPGDACPGAASVDSGFIEGWYDGIHNGGYVPVYYGNGTAGSEFAAAWCAAVSTLPNIATDSALWSFEPSLMGSYNKVSNPGYGPYDPGCGGNTLAWQYVLSAGAVVDVDQDEALSSLPLWYPSS
jgi:hypothetical protein